MLQCLQYRAVSIAAASRLKQRLLRRQQQQQPVFCPVKFFCSVLASDTQLISAFSAVNFKRFLKIKNIQFEDGFTNISINCPVCEKNPDNSKSSLLYINKVTGFFVCYQCKHSGKWDWLKTYLDSRKTKALFERFHSEAAQNFSESRISYERDVQKVFETTKPFRCGNESESQHILDRFDLKIDSLDVFETLECRYDFKTCQVFFPLRNVIDETVGFKKLSIVRNRVVESTIPAKNCSGIILGKAATKSKTNQTIVVTSVIDYLHLLNTKSSVNVVLLPHSVHSLPLELLPTLENFSKLIFWFKNDINSWSGIKDLAKKLHEARCFLIRNDDLPLAVSDTKTFKYLLASAQQISHKCITTFSSLRDEVLNEIGNIEKAEGIKWKRFPTLNKYLKGHRRGELTVVTGPTGCGKTTFISEYSLDLALQNVNTLWGSFEIRNVRLARTMLQQFAEIPLESNLDRFNEFADRFEQLPIYFMTFHGQQSIKIVMETIEHATYVHDISHVIIDNVQFMMGVSDESKSNDRFWKQDVIIAMFRLFATKKNCHVTLVIHPRKERETDDLTSNSIFGGAKASQEADNVLIIQDKRLSSLRGKRYLQIAKNRYAGDLGVLPLTFDKDSLGFAEKRKSHESAD